MSKYTRDPTLEDFLEWCKNDKDTAEEFFRDCILPDILELEGDDYFGTEGFDKRFG